MRGREAAREIWKAGVAAVRSDEAVRRVVTRTGHLLKIAEEEFDLREWRRIVVVGAGKAGAGMAAGLEQALGTDLLHETLPAVAGTPESMARITGWVNVPADCLRPLQAIHLHPARPAGINEPTAEGVAGSLKILELASSLSPRDLCLVLISGGGSALLPAPIPEISLADKQAVTRFLMNSGATIAELNTVRKQLSLIKGGRLAGACRAGAIRALIISDVVGDPLDIIASGPTVADPATAEDALAVLDKIGAQPPAVPESIGNALKKQVRAEQLARQQSAVQSLGGPPPSCSNPGFQESQRVRNLVIANNRVAVEAAARKAAALGYQVNILGCDQQGEASAVGVELAQACRQVRTRWKSGETPVCLLSGGEPVVQLPKDQTPRKGGRNQQLVLAALEYLAREDDLQLQHLTFLSGGTDGEDGPTDAAGAWADAGTLTLARQLQLDLSAFFKACNAYPFFQQTGSLLLTGPTHTNVMDLRVALID